MRVLVFFDLPSVHSTDKRNYRRFRKFLIKEGFVMLQESVYCKLVLNYSVLKSIKKKVENNSPSKGIVQILSITEKQYAAMDYITGSSSRKVLDSTDRLIVIWL